MAKIYSAGIFDPLVSSGPQPWIGLIEGTGCWGRGVWGHTKLKVKWRNIIFSPEHLKLANKSLFQENHKFWFLWQENHPFFNLSLWWTIIGVCAGRHPIPDFYRFQTQRFFGRDLDLYITYQTFLYFSSSGDDLNIVGLVSFIITKIMAEF